jgi:hypothetical protein
MIALSRVLVPLLGLIVWGIIYLHARYAYKLQRGGKKFAIQFSLLLGTAALVVLQVNLMERLTPEDAYGNYFFWFILIECGGGLMVLFTTLIRGRAKKRKADGTAQI